MKLTPAEFEQYHEEVFQDGASKHGANSWLEGVNFNKRANEMSMLRHYYQAVLVGNQLDDDSKLFHLQHLATRALMEVYAIKKGIR